MHLIGIDIGTQSLKAVVVTAELRVIGEASVPYQPSFPRPGWAEQLPSLWLDALPQAIAAALAAAGITPAAVATLAVCGQLDGCIGVDANGTALAPAIIWMDRRGAAMLDGIDPVLIRERTGLVRDATHMAAKIAWSRANLPDSAVVACWHQPVSFMVEALTGERVIDPALASTTMLYGLGRRDFDPELLAMFGIDRHHLPKVFPAAAVAGHLSRPGAALTGLPIGLPVATGTGDDFSTLIGSGIHRPGVVGVTLGTAEIIGTAVTRLIIDPALLVETHAYLPGTYMMGNPGWLSGGAVTWALALFGIATPEELSLIAATAPPGCDGLTFIPALTGAMAPRWHAGARGAFYGLTPSHGKAHCARAILEGTAFAMRDVVDRLDGLGVETGILRLMGGGARSAIWAQIRADISSRPVEIVETGDSSALGAALLAAVAAGYYADVAAAGPALPQPTRRLVPDPGKAAAYDEAYHRYQELFGALAPLFDRT